MNVSKRTYGDYSSNYGTHCMEITVGNLSIYFSYDTVVAFSDPSTGRVVTQNDWSTTTGKHLNAIDGGDKKSRLPRAEFEAKLAEVLKKHDLTI